MNQPIKKIPYGKAEFGELQRNNMYYADKTAFIPLLESASDYLFFIRPRRFGKTLWLSVLQYYYDINEKENFEEVFRDTYILKHPIGPRHTYLIMAFNFAMVNPDSRYLEELFEENGKTMIRDFLKRYERFFNTEEQLEILALKRTEHQLREIFSIISRKRLKLYLFIDEYDNFANTILTTDGTSAYLNLTRGQGFFRFFFNLLKNATSAKGSGLNKLFITGVSPVTMDDVTSGFNIGDNISLDARFNQLLGFNQDEVRELLRHYQNASAGFTDIDHYLEMMGVWYDNYKFDRKGGQASVYNADMVLYFIKEAMKDTDSIPVEMIDPNIKIDYGKLRHLMQTDRRLNGNFSELQKIIEQGDTTCKLRISFPSEQVADRRNFVSLLFYFGLLSIAGVRGQQQVLAIPNMTVKKLMYGYIRDAFYDNDIFRIDIWELADKIYTMAYQGKWRPVIDFLAKEIKTRTAIRNYIQGESTVQMLLLAYLNVCDYFIPQTEREMSKGYADIFLEPFSARFPDMQFGYLIELKYMARTEASREKHKEKICKNVEEATRQLQQYARDEQIHSITAGYTLKKLVLVYCGWELVHASEL